MTISSFEPGAALPPTYTSPLSAPAEAADGAQSIDLLRIVALFVREWRTGLLAAVIVFFLAAVLVLRMPKQYEASAVILPKDQAAAGNSLTALFTGARPNSNSVSLLLSRTLRNDVVRRADLMKSFHAASQEGARGRLAGMTKITPSGDTIIILVRDSDAAQATRIANTYVDALRSLQETMATSQSDVQRHFFELQIEHEKAALAQAELSLEKMQEGSGIVQMDTQTQIGLGAIAGTRAQITNLQVRLAALLQSATEENPEVKTLRSQIAQLESQERSLEGGATGSRAGVAAPAGRMPGVNLEYTRRARDVKYHETLVNSLTSHFEDLRLGAGALGDTFDVLDRAVIPEAPTWPPRRLFLLLALAAALFTGLLAIALRLLARRVWTDPVQRAYLSEIRQGVARRR